MPISLVPTVLRGNAVQNALRRSPLVGLADEEYAAKRLDEIAKQVRLQLAASR